VKLKPIFKNHDNEKKRTYDKMCRSSAKRKRAESNEMTMRQFKNDPYIAEPLKLPKPCVIQNEIKTRKKWGVIKKLLDGKKSAIYEQMKIDT